MEMAHVTLAYLEELRACTVEGDLAALERVRAGLFKREHDDLLRYLISNKLLGMFA